MLTSRGAAAVGWRLALRACAAATGDQAQDHRAAARELVKKWQDAVVNVRVVVKMRMSMGGREVQSSDDTLEAVGTVIDPGGLTVVSLGSINPGGDDDQAHGRRRRGPGGRDRRASRPT